jgi:putative endonuclease
MKDALGIYGESEAYDYLVKKGYEIVQRNYTCKIGEIDLIIKDKNELVFVEVKCRSSLYFGRPCEAVNYKKQRKIIRTTQNYIKEKNAYKALVRFDIIEVLANKCGNNFQLNEINHIKNAFDA